MKTEVSKLASVLRREQGGKYKLIDTAPSGESEEVMYHYNLKNM